MKDTKRINSTSFKIGTVRLLNNGVEVSAYDPIAIGNAKKIIEHDKLYFGEDMYDVLNGADALILCTEWSDFRSPDFSRMKSVMGKYVIFDGKNIFTINFP